MALPKSSPGPRPRVLVVDDEEALRHLLHVILERNGYEPVEAADGRQAIARLDADPDLPDDDPPAAAMAVAAAMPP